jgi:hypothetical protein
MALLNQSTQVYTKIGELFEALRKGQAPEKFNREFLKDLGFKSSNWHAVIPLFKGLGFLSEDGSPKSRYMEFLDPTKWRKVLAEAVNEAYGDIFIIKKRPTSGDLPAVIGKYKSTYNLSDTQAERAARTFLALYELCDKDAIDGQKAKDMPPTASDPAPDLGSKSSDAPQKTKMLDGQPKPPLGLHYNIQIHLPATKDVEVYNAIFRSLREHIID